MAIIFSKLVDIVFGVLWKLCNIITLQFDNGNFLGVEKSICVIKMLNLFVFDINCLENMPCVLKELFKR